MLCGYRSCHLVVWFKVARKPRCSGFIRDFKGKGLVVVMKGNNTASTPYLR